MKTYIVLFRGINVGGKNLVPMKDLVEILGQHNYQHIRTYIQSGNIVLQNHEKPEDIAAIVQDRFGFKPEVYVLEAAEFIAAVENNPFESPRGKEIHLYFCKETPEPDGARLEKYKSDSEKYHLEGQVFYLFAPDGIGRSKLVANIETCLGVTVTGRNLNTIHKLQQMVRDTN